MSSNPGSRRRATLRDNDTVMPLELFFDLVFVLALTQSTALMAHHPSWEGLAQGLLVLAVMWWSWTGYSWLTSVVDPEDGVVRIALAISIAALMVCSLCIPGAFGDDGLMFAIAYGFVRAMHVVLLMHASRDNPGLRKSTTEFAMGAAIGCGLLIAASQADGSLQAALWGAAVVADFGGALAADAEGWQLQPHHFAERHGLIIIIALGESIVAVGAGADGESLTTGVVAVSVLGALLSFGLWWLYFDVSAEMAGKRLSEAPQGIEQNRAARDAYSYFHLPMVAGIVLVALGLKKAIGHFDAPLELVPAVALFGGLAMYLLGHVGTRWRIVSTMDRSEHPNARAINRQRVAFALLFLALVPVTRGLDSIVLVTTALVVVTLLVVIEVRMQGDFRRSVRAAIGGHDGGTPAH